MRLLQRTTRALHLTQEGEVFYAAAQRIVGEIEALENQIVGESGTPSGVLRVTTSLAFATHQLAPVLSEFLARYPLVQLELLPTDRVIDMVEEGIDIAHAHRPARRYQLHGAQDRRGQTPDLRRAVLPRAPRHAAGGPRTWRGTTASCRANMSISIAGLQDRRPGERDRGRRPGRRQRGRGADAAGAAGHRHRPPDAAHPGPAIRDGALVSLLGDFSADEPVAIHAVYPHRRHLARQGPGLRQFPDREVHAAALGDLTRRVMLGSAEPAD